MDMERQAIMGSEAELDRNDGASSPEGRSSAGGSSTSGKRPVLPEALAEPLAEPLAVRAKFYTSLCLGTTAILSAFLFLFLIPFVVDPAISTILSDFEPEAVTCITSQITYVTGLKNCTSPSCREGCTTAAPKCYHILVNYSRVPYAKSLQGLEVRMRRRRREAASPPPPSSTSPPPGDVELPVTEKSQPADHPTPPKSRKRQPHPLGGKSVTALVEAPPQPKVEEEAAAAATSEESATVFSPSPAGEREGATGEEAKDSIWDEVNIKFLVNTEGCGYPPRVNCTIFLKQYDPNLSPEGPKIFPCYYSRTDSNKVVAKYSPEENIKHLVLSLIVPNIIFVGSLAILSYWYCPGCCGRRRGDGMGSVAGSVACSPVLGSISGGSLRRGSGKSLRGSSSTDRLPTKEEDIDEEDEDDEEY